MPIRRPAFSLFVSAAAVLASLLTTAFSALSLYAQTGNKPANPPDKYLWLEDVHSPRAMAWVKAQDARTAKILEADPRFGPYSATALKVLEDPHRLPEPDLRGNDVYNFWRDQHNIHGLLRRTTIADYNVPGPHWQTVLDIDALDKQEHIDWVFHGLPCLYPGDRYCLADLSAGGEDASTAREFDLQAARFVPSGFISPHSKQDISWLDKDTLLIARDWGPGTMTRSGYAYIVKEWKRGTPLASAKEVFRGQPTDISAAPFVLHDAQGHHAVFFERSPTFFTSLTFLQTPSGLRQLAIPPKSDVVGLLDGRLLVNVRQNWAPTPSAPVIHEGSLIALRLADVLRDPAHLHPTIVFAPSADEFLDGEATTRNRLIVVTLKHVLGQAYVYTPSANDSWTRRSLDVPTNSAIGIVTTSDTSDAFYLSAESFLIPPSLLAGDAASGSVSLARSQPPLFDASRDTVAQLYATSKDGTRIPYFLVHPKNMPLNGQNPTLLNAYGGFQVSETPHYSALLGKLWLEKGGVFVLANIRGGGEFGPAWHEAGLKTHRQRVFDDFAAVAQDLIARKITSPRRLGIMGGSNGGLLMGVEMTQHPDLFHAIVIQVPLLDMLRYEKIAAGASWVAEYGSVSVPAERAFLAKISPYNQLKPGVHYPEPFLFTTTADDRVGPQHARKFAAKLEEFHDPFLYDEITEGGHGPGADLRQDAHTWAETYVYLAKKLMD